jgi:hypothetical protein
VPAHDTARVSSELDEVEAVQDRQRAREVGEEDDARLQRSYEQRLASGVVGGDLGAELADADAQLGGGEVDLADALVGIQASSRRYRCARRSTSRL